MGAIGSPWQNRSCTWRNNFSMNNICSQRSYWLGRSRNTRTWPKIFKGFDSVGIGRLAPTIIAEPDFGFWPHWSTWVCTGQDSHLFSSLLLHVMVSRLASQFWKEWGTKPCHLRMRYSHPAILKYARCNKLTTQRKSRSSFFLNGLHGPGAGSASRLRHCVPITRVPSAQKPTNFSKKPFLKVSMQDSGPILLPGLSQKTRITLKKLAYLLSLGWRSLKTFERVTDFQHPKKVTITELPGSYPLQFPIGSIIFLYLPTFDWSFW